MVRTRSASASLTVIFRSLVSYPSGAMPPTQRPLRLEAAILSRMRSEVTSRSNWANESRTFRVSRPMDVVVLNCWVTETNETLCWSAGASDRERYLGQARIGLALPGKTILKHRHPLRLPVPLASKHGARPHIDGTPGHGPLPGL